MHTQTFLDNFATIAEAPGGVQRLRDLVLDLAFRGRIVPQDDSEGPASVLLRHGESRHTRTEPLESPYRIPVSWEWVRFGDVAESRLGKMLDKAKNVGPLRAYLRNANVQWFRFDLGSVYELRLEEKEIETYTLRTGDLIICEGGEPGRAAVCDSAVDGMVFQKALHRSRPDPGINVWYLAYLLRRLATSGELASYYTGATIKHLTGRSLALVQVPLPPGGEQERIVAKVNELMGLCDELEMRMAASDGLADRTAAALVRSVGGTT
jgi:Restriction endonuclease S subunits